MKQVGGWSKFQDLVACANKQSPSGFFQVSDPAKRALMQQRAINEVALEGIYQEMYSSDIIFWFFLGTVLGTQPLSNASVSLDEIKSSLGRKMEPPTQPLVILTSLQKKIAHLWYVGSRRHPQVGATLPSLKTCNKYYVGEVGYEGS